MVVCVCVCGLYLVLFALHSATSSVVYALLSSHMRNRHDGDDDSVSAAFQIASLALSLFSSC